MESVFIKSIRIDKIRHLENIDINICDSERRHVIVTGKNGSVKTSLLDVTATFINSVTLEDNLWLFHERYKKETAGIWMEFNKSFVELRNYLKRANLLLLIIRQTEFFHLLNRSM